MKLLKILTVLLLLVNLCLLPFATGRVAVDAANGESARMSAQIAPERIRLVFPSQAQHEAPASPAPAIVPSMAAIAPPSPLEPAPPHCRLVSHLSRAQTDALLQAARALEGVQASEQAAVEARSWWVNIPPLPNRQAAERKLAELKALGIKEVALMPDSDPNRNAISLGLFKNEAAAREVLDALVGRGLRNARITVREGGANLFDVRLKANPERLDQLWHALPPELGAVQPTPC